MIRVCMAAISVLFLASGCTGGSSSTSPPSTAGQPGNQASPTGTGGTTTTASPGKPGAHHKHPGAEAQVKLTTGHCTVEPVHFDGRTWAIPWDYQIGWGGRLPPGWASRGTIARTAADQARYIDRGGAKFNLVPAGSPAAQPPRHWGCD